MSQWITPDVAHPAPRNLSSELDQIYQANQRQAGPYYDLEAKYGPLYNRMTVRNLADQTLGWDENGVHQPGTQEIGRTATQAQREQDIADVEKLGPREREAYLAANPWLRRSLGLLADRQTDSPILQTLNQQAEGALASAGKLSPQEQRDLDQQSLALFADNGIAHGNQAIGAQLLNRDAATRSRMAAQQQFASGVQGLNQAQNDFLGRSTQIDATALSDPWMAILNRSSGAGGGAGAGLTPIGSGTKVFDPYNAYAQDLFNTNFNEQASRGIANAQNQANTRTAIATVASGFIGSDIRMKEKIVEIGRSPLFNLPIVEFEYRAGCVPKGLRPVRYIGTLADEVEAVFPEAVRIDPKTGFKQVDYSMIDIDMKEAA
jgi:hypothetical protein